MDRVESIILRGFKVLRAMAGEGKDKTRFADLDDVILNLEDAFGGGQDTLPSLEVSSTLPGEGDQEVLDPAKAALDVGVASQILPSPEPTLPT